MTPATIRAIRRTLHLSQSQMGRRLSRLGHMTHDVPIGTISRWEQGTRVPTAYDVVKGLTTLLAKARRNHVWRDILTKEQKRIPPQVAAILVPHGLDIPVALGTFSAREGLLLDLKIASYLAWVSYDQCCLTAAGLQKAEEVAGAQPEEGA